MNNDIIFIPEKKKDWSFRSPGRNLRTIVAREKVLKRAILCAMLVSTGEATVSEAMELSRPKVSSPSNRASSPRQSKPTTLELADLL